MRQILLLDDDPVTHTIVKGVLDHQYEIVSCFSIKEAQDYLASDSCPVLAIIDRALPDGDGLTICSNMRADTKLNHVPIIFLSSKSSETDKVTGLFAGGDDYITKPFSPIELKARVQARLRNEQSKLVFGNLVIDLSSHRSFIETGAELKEIELTRKEFKLMSLMAHHPDRVFSRDELLSKIWGNDTHVNDRVVDTSISNLRKKLVGSGINIESLRGEGYKAITTKTKNQAA